MRVIGQRRVHGGAVLRLAAEREVGAPEHALLAGQLQHAREDGRLIEQR